MSKLYIDKHSNRIVRIKSTGYYGYSTAIVEDVETKKIYHINRHFLVEAECQNSPLYKLMDKTDEDT